MNNEFSPLQVFRYCPRCGRPGLEPLTGKSLECKSCGFTYFVNMNAAVAAIIRNEDGEVLFTIRRHDPAAGLLDLPGGFVDLGETAEAAVKREIFEELNLEITRLHYAGTFCNTYLYSGIAYQTLDMVFECSVESFKGIQAADDVSGYVFRSPGSLLPEEIGLDSIRKIVSELG